MAAKKKPTTILDAAALKILRDKAPFTRMQLISMGITLGKQKELVNAGVLVPSPSMYNPFLFKVSDEFCK